VLIPINQPSITVIGSYAVGMTIGTPHFPTAGETVMGYRFHMLHGGKGSNQAVVCSRMGAKVLFGACVGDDKFGEMCMSLHAQENVDARYIKKSDRGTATGTGIVLVNDQGENEIVIDFGANLEFSPADVDAMLPDIKKTKLVMMQLEMNMDTVLHVARRCREMSLPFILNPAPYQPLPQELLPLCTYLTPNQTEARQILGLSSTDTTPEDVLASRLLDLGAQNVAMTLGKRGALLANDGGIRHFASIPVEAVDTTGAGDSFNGMLGTALAEGKTCETAIQYAVIAAGLAVTKFGVIESIAYRDEVEHLYQEIYG
jgi:ribokinase